MSNVVEARTFQLTKAWNGRFYSDPTKTPPDGYKLWSDPSAWPGGVVPTASTDVVIDTGDLILLNGDAVAHSLIIRGSGALIIRNGYDSVTLTVGMIHGEDDGLFIIGQPLDYYRGRCRIIFNGTPPTSPATNDGHQRSFMIHDSFTFHDYSLSPTPFVRLGAHASAAATSLTVSTFPDNWNSGNEIVLSHTGYYGKDGAAEVRALASDVSSTTLAISTGLANAKWGLLQYLTDGGDSSQHVDGAGAGWTLTPGLPLTLAGDASPGDIPTTLDERSVVANLYRGVTFESIADADWTGDGFGFHIMIMSRLCDVVIDGAEFLRGGQQGHLGRYPIHWHMLSYNVVPNTIAASQSSSSISSALTLTIPSGTTLVTLLATGTSSIRYTTDGSTPTSSVGTLVTAKTAALPITSWTSIKVIQVTSGGAVKASYFEGDSTYLGDIPTGKAVVRNCVFRDSSQRGAVVHGTCGVLVEDNVAYNCTGHTWFLEDASERRNTFRRNLTIAPVSMPSGNLSTGWPRRLQDHEEAASGCWITCGDNYFYDNLNIGCPGIGTWVAIPLTPMGLSSRIPGYYPLSIEIGEIRDQYNFGNGDKGQQTRICPIDSIANAGTTQYKYEPTDDGTPTGTQVRLELTGIHNIKNQFGYENLVSWPTYRGWLVVDNFVYGFNGVTTAGDGPADARTGKRTGIIEYSVLSGQSLNVMAHPTAWGVTKIQRGMATYHGSVRPMNCFGVNLPMVDYQYSGFMRFNDLYTEQQVTWLVDSTGIRLLNSNFGWVSPPGFITGYPGNIFNEYPNLCTALWDPHNLFKCGANKWHTMDTTFHTYDALNPVACPVATPTATHGNGVMIDNAMWGIEFTEMDSSWNPGAGVYVKTTFTRFDDSMSSVGTFVVDKALSGDGTAIDTTYVKFAASKGHSQSICRYRGVFDTYGPATTRLVLRVTGMSNSSADKMLLGVPWQPTTGTKYFQAVAAPGVTRTPTAGANLAAVLADTAGTTYWHDTTNHIAWFLFVGGLHPTNTNLDLILDA